MVLLQASVRLCSRQFRIAHRRTTLHRLSLFFCAGRISNRITKRRIRPFPYRQQSLSRPLYPRGYTHIAYTRLYRNRPYRNLRFKRLIRKILSVHNLYKRNTNRLSELHVRNEWIYATLSINCQLHRQRKNKKRHFSCQNVECRPYRCLPTLGR